MDISRHRTGEQAGYRYFGAISTGRLRVEATALTGAVRQCLSLSCLPNTACGVS